jgi:hypothetical protein
MQLTEKPSDEELPEPQSTFIIQKLFIAATQLSDHFVSQN